MAVMAGLVLAMARYTMGRYLYRHWQDCARAFGGMGWGDAVWGCVGGW